MNNQYLDARTIKDIDQRVDRVHRDLGYIDGKINLAEVRALLTLDLKYYQLDDPNLLNEVVHKVKVGAKQVFERPGLLVDAVRKFDLSALFIPDLKRIFIDANVPDLKKRWYESHEVAHSLIPWHQDYMLGDDRTTLSQACHQLIEAEANYGAGRLLFPNAAFTEARVSGELTLSHVRSIAKAFGNTITSTLWRCVEHSDDVVFASIGEHPRRAREGRAVIEHFIRSRKFETQFAHVTDKDVWSLLQMFCSHLKAGPLGQAEVQIEAGDRVSYVFSVECFSNGYDTLTLGRLLRTSIPLVSVPSRMPIDGIVSL